VERRAAPLAGVVVVDLSRLLPGPLTSRLLADLGARVIKVEEPRSGDPVRLAPPIRGATSALAALLLSGVESIALDLDQEPAREVLHRLLEDADVLLESFRPGTLARFGLAPEELRRRHPHLVICSLSGFGQDGPRAARAGHDLTYQALAGTLAPAARMPAVPVADHAGAWSAALAVLAALYRRDSAPPDAAGAGEGEHVDASLYDAALHTNLVNWAAEAAGERAVGERLALSGALACYNLYGTNDRGYVALACLEPHFWRRFCGAVEKPEWVRRHLDAGAGFKREVQKLVGRRGRAEWAELAERLDLPIEPVLSAAEAAGDPQALQRRVVARGADGLLRLAYPALLGGERLEPAERLPALGEDTDALLDELGVDLDRGERREGGIGPRGRLRRAVRRWAVKRKAPRG
jgi:crotonobetainyl-CoA:carnitine CoA-transferase CaiB-like acyl-CoA transferase